MAQEAYRNVSGGRLQPLFRRPLPVQGHTGGDIVFILVFVADLLIASKSTKAEEETRESITTAFKASDMGDPTYVLRRHVDRDALTWRIQLGQRQYLPTILDRFLIGEANQVRLPMGAGDCRGEDSEQLPEDLSVVYQELVGALLYLSTCIRPDMCSQSAACPATWPSLQ